LWRGAGLIVLRLVHNFYKASRREARRWQWHQGSCQPDQGGRKGDSSWEGGTVDATRIVLIKGYARRREVRGDETSERMMVGAKELGGSEQRARRLLKQHIL
jgi:hypothetical protein